MPKEVIGIAAPSCHLLSIVPPQASAIPQAAEQRSLVTAC